MFLSEVLDLVLQLKAFFFGLSKHLLLLNELVYTGVLFDFLLKSGNFLLISCFLLLRVLNFAVSHLCLVLRIDLDALGVEDSLCVRAVDGPFHDEVELLESALQPMVHVAEGVDDVVLLVPRSVDRLLLLNGTFLLR